MELHFVYCPHSMATGLAGLLDQRPSVQRQKGFLRLVLVFTDPLSNLGLIKCLHFLSIVGRVKQQVGNKVGIAKIFGIKNRCEVVK